MSYKACRLRRKNSSGSYDIILLASRSDLSLRFKADGTENGSVESTLVTLEAALESATTGISAKASKITSGTKGNIVAIGDNGEIVDSGKQPGDFAAASHGTHVTYSSTSPAAAGTAAVGTASTVSRSDHVHPAQTSVTGNAGTATKLATARSVDGVNFDGTAGITHYGTCSTAAGTTAKVVSLTGFVLATGARVAVKFTVTNSATNPTLNVNSTGAKPIYYRGAAITAGYLAANHVYEFVYDGTNYELIGDIDTDTNTTYTPASAAPKAAGTAAVGTSVKYAREDHVHPAQTSVTGNAGTATKLETARTISLSGDVSGSISFDGSADKTLSAALVASGVTSGQYGANTALEDTMLWLPTNRNINSTTATLQLVAKTAGTITFTYDVSSESSYDKFTCKVNGTALVNAVSGNISATTVTSASFAVGNIIEFTFVKDSSTHSGRDIARFYDLKHGTTSITPANIEQFFTVKHVGQYTFIGCQAIRIPVLTVDTKGRITAASTVVIGVGTSTMIHHHTESGAAEPTNQLAGDLWFETIS